MLVYFIFIKLGNNCLYYSFKSSLYLNSMKLSVIEFISELKQTLAKLPLSISKFF